MISGKLDRDQFRYARVFHRYAVERARRLHGALAVRDNHKLRLSAHLDDLVGEASDVHVVERRVNLVEQAERAWTVFEYRQDQRHGGHGLLAARQQQNILKPLARRLRDDLDPAFENVSLVDQLHLAMAAAEQLDKHLLEIFVDGGERLYELLARPALDLGDRRLSVRNRFLDVHLLIDQEIEPVFDL